MNRSNLIKLNLFITMVFMQAAVTFSDEGIRPIADAGLSRYAAKDPVQLDGSGSYDPDESGLLSYSWRQISGPTVTISETHLTRPTMSGFVQTDEIQECEFELIVSDGDLNSVPDIVKVTVVPNFGTNMLQQENPPFDPNKPTIIYFSGGDGIVGFANEQPWLGGWNTSRNAWSDQTNVIGLPEGYEPDTEAQEAWRTYYHLGDMIIVHLSSVAPKYNQPIQVVGWSTGGQPATDLGIRLNRIYNDTRYAVTHVTHLDSPYTFARGTPNEQYHRPFGVAAVDLLITSSVGGKQCWLDSYFGAWAQIANVDIPEGILAVSIDLSHFSIRNWYGNSLTGNDMNKFNNGIVAGAFWSVVGSGKNLQLTQKEITYYFSWSGNTLNGKMSLFDDVEYPSRLPQPVVLVEPMDGSFVDSDGALFSCENSENAVSYQLLFGSDPDRIMDYYIISDTSSPPAEVLMESFFKQTWWTIKVRDQHGTSIYADPICVEFENLKPSPVENITIGKEYGCCQRAIDDAQNGDEIVIRPGVYKEGINFKGKNLTFRSTYPNDPAVISGTIIINDGDVVTFANGENANCIIAGFTITGGNRGICCSGASPTITNCKITGNAGTEMGAGIYLKEDSNPTLINCLFNSNSASVMGGGMYSENSNPTLINCTFSSNSAAYFAGGIYCATGSPAITNCIIWDNIPDEISVFGSTPLITYSDIKGGAIGEGNIDAEPLFVDPENGDYHLKSQAGRWDPISQNWIQDDVTSPCIDAGDPTSLVGFEPSPNGGRINLGAYGGTDKASKSP